ncbi:SIMPL domain-containing protein [Candidatus Peregrinibacteria bacterium]|nr:SIMPL domain-containing protein [Candidatus Peregrinibacteria bacterium]
MEDHRLFLRPPLWLPLIVVLLAGGAYIAGKFIETRNMNMFTISVQGDGKVQAMPDIASLSFGVTTGRQPTAEAAMKMLTQKMTKVIDSVKAVGIEEKDVYTQYLSLNPSYDWQDGRQVDRGFEASQSLTVKVRDLAKITEVLDSAVKSGANQAGSVSFTIDDPELLQAQAREEAIKDAKARAELLAKDLGVKLGELQGFYENTGGYPMPYMERAVMMDASVGKGGGGMAPPIPSGEQEINVSVNLTYRIR